MQIMYRFLAAIVALAAVVWTGEVIITYRLEADYRVYYATQVAPRRAAEMQKLEAYLRTTKDQLEHPDAKIPPVPPDPLGLRVPDKSGEWIARIDAHAGRGRAAKMIFFCATVALSLLRLVDEQRKRLHAQAANRPADIGAGLLVSKLVQSQKSLRAQGPGGTENKAIEIDGQRAVVRFHNCAFIHAFVGNPTQTRVELPFSGILSAVVETNRYTHSLVVRTAQGQVVLPGDLQPFQEVADLLADIAELNRTKPGDYAAALAQEPKIKTAWYGWLILAAAVGAVIYCGWKFMYQ